jgi:hypothetical protein
VERGYIKNFDFEHQRQLLGIHENKVGILLGNGPSVRLEDLDFIQDRNNHFVCFACNRIHLAYDKTKLRPDYILSSDEQVIEDFGQEIIENNRQVFFISKIRPFFTGAYIWFKLKNGRPFHFSKNPTFNVMSGGGTLISALQLGYYMGIRKFYLYGVDHSFNFQNQKKDSFRNASGEGNHFIKAYRGGKSWQAPVMDLVEEAFIKCDKLLRSEGGFLINSTRGGKLEVLERRSFDDIV